jgi:hypothetical protein
VNDGTFTLAVLGCLLGLGLCAVMDAVAIGRLQAEVEFLTTLVGEDMLRSATDGR